MSDIPNCHLGSDRAVVFSEFAPLNVGSSYESLGGLAVPGSTNTQSICTNSGGNYDAQSYTNPALMYDEHAIPAAGHSLGDGFLLGDLEDREAVSPILFNHSGIAPFGCENNALAHHRLEATLRDYNTIATNDFYDSDSHNNKSRSLNPLGEVTADYPQPMGPSGDDFAGYSTLRSRLDDSIAEPPETVIKVNSGNNRAEEDPLAAKEGPKGKKGRNGAARVPCTHQDCKKTFARTYDMRRHAMKHELGRAKLQCGVKGCGYDGSHRLDKMASHMKNCHLNGNAYEGVISIGEYCFPGFGDCQFSQDFLESEDFRGGYCYWGKRRLGGWNNFIDFLTEDSMGIKKITCRRTKDSYLGWTTEAMLV